MSTAERQSGRTEFHWFKSSYSGGNGGECVEVARAVDAVLVRDSEDPEPRLMFDRDEWATFLAFAARR